MLRLLCCFLSLICLGWSANEYKTTASSHQLVPQTQHHHHHSAPEIYEKEIFFFSAPEEKFDQSETLLKLITSVTNHQQVIFIKNPENKAYKKIGENLVQNADIQKTHIYIQNKEPEYAGFKPKFHSIQANTQHKPELKFLNYRNPSEDEHIQSSIVQKYGGSSVKPLLTNPKNIYTRSVVKDSLPVSKNYASKFLPSDVDVVPGSSYIPLV